MLKIQKEYSRTKEEYAHSSFTNKLSIDSHKDDNSYIPSDNSHYSLILDVEIEDNKDTDRAFSSLSSRKLEVFKELNTLMKSKNFAEIQPLFDMSNSKDLSLSSKQMDSRLSEGKSDKSNKSIISHNSCEFDVLKKTGFLRGNSGNVNNLI